MFKQIQITLYCKYILLFVFVSSNEEEWYKFRSTVNPVMMHPKVMKPYAERIDPVANEFLDMMRQLAQNNPSGEMPENFSKEIHKFTLEVALLVGMDRRIGSKIIRRACPVPVKLRPSHDIVHELIWYIYE